MKTIEEEAREILEAHDCRFIKMTSTMSSQHTVVWQNKFGYESWDDICVLRHTTPEAWDFWSNYNPTN